VLASLSPQRAMAYARRLVVVRYAGEPDRQQKILTRLQKASTQEATGRSRFEELHCVDYPFSSDWARTALGL
jgi:hypothetical protein